MKKAAIGAILGALSVAAHADAVVWGLMENLYGGIAAGPSHIGKACDGGAIDCKNTQAPGFKYWGGWKMSDRIAGEISYVNFERAKAAYATAPGRITTTAYRADAFLFNLAFYQPITQDFTGIARVGLARTHSTSTTGINSAVSKTSRRNQGDTSPYLGAALNVDFQGIVSKSGIMPFPQLDNFHVEIGVDVTRTRINGVERSLRLWSVGGAFEF